MSKRIIEVNWDRYSDQYDAVTMGGANPAYLELVEVIRDYFSKEIQIRKNSLVIDLGGGTGNFSLPLAELYRDSQFLILDTSIKMLQIAEEKARRKGLRNISCLLRDAEEIYRVAEEYSRPLDHVIMIHCLYATPEEDLEKPKRILKNIYNALNDKSSRFFISDINRQLETSDWIPYCLRNAFKSYKRSGNGIFQSLRKTIQLFRENDQSKLANRHIDMKQKEGAYLLCDIEFMEKMIREAGFSEIYKKTDKYYRGRDNLIVAGK